ncbi:MAG: hypothetical protein IPF50_15820 [Proteobacteria bacterium]|nr:hypothetical protein [Pseudomonadota bacterium]
MIVELGGNDGLRGLPVADIRRNFEAIVGSSQQAGARILLVGMKIPPNYGPPTPATSTACMATWRGNTSCRACHSCSRTWPSTSLFQEDGIHPTAAAQPRLLDEVWPHLQPLLARSRYRFRASGPCSAAALLYRPPTLIAATAAAQPPGDPSWKRSGCSITRPACRPKSTRPSTARCAS